MTGCGIVVTKHARDRYRQRWGHGGTDASLDEQISREVSCALLCLRVTRDPPPEMPEEQEREGRVYCWTENRRKVFVLREHWAVSDSIGVVTVVRGNGAEAVAA